jgi:hypothetical protein
MKYLHYETYRNEWPQLAVRNVLIQIYDSDLLIRLGEIARRREIGGLSVKNDDVATRILESRVRSRDMVTYR